MATREGNERIAQQAAERFGAIDLLFLNAGIEDAVTPLREYPKDVFNRVMQGSVRGVFLGLKHISTHVKDDGSIVLTPSTRASSKATCSTDSCKGIPTPSRNAQLPWPA